MICVEIEMLSLLDSARVDPYFNDIALQQTLPAISLRQLMEAGFVIIPGPISSQRFPELSAAYDEVMNAEGGPDLKVGSTTTRMYDLVNRGPAFDDVYTHPALLEACRSVIGEPFKLSSLLGRTVRPRSPAQELHVDLARNSTDAPMIGFILMIDPFNSENGATRFVPGSQYWPDVPSERITDTRAFFPGEIAAYGEAGSVIIFNGAIWHGHSANNTHEQRRSIQGYFVRRDAQSGINFSTRMRPETLGRISALARYLLSL
jgi:Phytanoyl-CoA dioxygenase (PhyH)